jgi:hypothetical protein
MGIELFERNGVKTGAEILTAYQDQSDEIGVFKTLEEMIDDELNKKSLQMIANKVCDELPEGYSLFVEMEHGYGSITLQDSEGGNINVDDITDDTETTMDGKINAVLNIAIAMET